MTMMCDKAVGREYTVLGMVVGVFMISQYIRISENYHLLYEIIIIRLLSKASSFSFTATVYFFIPDKLYFEYYL